jgi:hypothetical protein
MQGSAAAPLRELTIGLKRRSSRSFREDHHIRMDDRVGCLDPSQRRIRKFD